MSQTHPRPVRQSPPATPRWVKVFGIIVLVLALLIVILHLTGHGMGGHGIGGHSMGEHGGQTPAVEQKIQQP